MLEVEKTLLNRFYQEFWIFLSLFISTLILFVILVIFYFVKIKRLTTIFKFVIPIVNVLLVTLCVFLGVRLSNFCADYAYLKSNRPVQIEGVLIGYANSISGDDLTVTKSWPIIMIAESKEEIVLNIINSEEKLKVDEAYVFLYLPNTKIAEVIKE